MRDYKDAKAARSAIEDRIRQKAEKDGSDISTIRRKFAFDALLERISGDGTFILKGGYAMELKNPAHTLKARPTRDMDFVYRLKTATDNVEFSIRMTLEDLSNIKPDTWPSKYFDFEFGRASLELDIGGYRYPVTAKMDGRKFEAFLIDVTHEDFLDKSRIEKVKTKTLNEIADVDSEATTITSPQKFAEKVHALTKPREKGNSRVKDLIDLVIIINQHDVDEQECRQALQDIFKHRATHEIPSTISMPPFSWHGEYETMAKNCSLRETTLEMGMKTLSDFYSRVLRVSSD
ncbi:nucleotidyl transferase AbiEii/AbiGii toxin family protein [Oligoflexus tunisiensis]|uniref:nucleotidyl transferase AbiEii/AbiGii toxin family protein n=1 Tax=Oligoflexus tunisiensis TaxID=708132 RepID=UPI00114D2DBA|nr:nucleotidyl transferase AbiEii/AbiGii toxin family protein [Oligoflexus tunisiensis]